MNANYPKKKSSHKQDENGHENGYNLRQVSVKLQRVDFNKIENNRINISVKEPKAIVPKRTLKNGLKQLTIKVQRMDDFRIISKKTVKEPAKVELVSAKAEAVPAEVKASGKVEEQVEEEAMEDTRHEAGSSQFEESATFDDMENVDGEENDSQSFEDLTELKLMDDSIALSLLSEDYDLAEDEPSDLLDLDTTDLLDTTEDILDTTEMDEFDDNELTDAKRETAYQTVEEPTVMDRSEVKIESKVREKIEMFDSNNIVEGSLICYECNTRFSAIDDLVTHVRTHYRKYHYGCAFCPRISKRKDNIQVHQEKHTQQKKSKRSNNVTPQVKVLNPNLKMQKHKCELCQMTFGYVWNLVRHMKTHSKEKKIHSCEYCPKRFPDKLSLGKHEKEHTRPKSFQCAKCPMKFSSQDAFTRHEETHNQPFPCSICPQTFKTQKILEKHEVKHTTDLEFECEQCPLKFSKKYFLKDHMLTHFEEDSFDCKVCHKRFVHKYMLLKHQNTHHREFLFSCEHCPEKYSLRETLLKHVKSKHSSGPSLLNESQKDPRHNVTNKVDLVISNIHKYDTSAISCLSNYNEPVKNECFVAQRSFGLPKM